MVSGFDPLARREVAYDEDLTGTFLILPCYRPPGSVFRWIIGWPYVVPFPPFPLLLHLSDDRTMYRNWISAPS